MKEKHRRKRLKRICGAELGLDGAALKSCEEMVRHLVADVDDPSKENVASLLTEVGYVRVHHALTCKERLARMEHAPGKACLRATLGSRITCMWMHGILTKKFKDRAPEIGFRKHLVEDDLYFESAHKNVPSCTHNVFLRMDTYDEGWDNDKLQRQYCKAIDLVQPNVLFTHSMGNNIIAAGIARGLPGCTDIGKEDDALVHWYGAGGPLEGSEVADELERQCQAKIHKASRPGLKLALHAFDLCRSKDKKTWMSSDLADISLYALRTTFVNPGTGYSPDEPALPQYSCETIKDSKKKCVTLKQIAEKHMRGSMCACNHDVNASVKKHGFLSAAKQHIKTWVTKTLFKTPWKHGDDQFKCREQDYRKRTGNDIAVGMHSCQLFGGKGYSLDPSSKLYVLEANHESADCSHGDLKEKSRQPCNWFNQRAQESAKLKTARNVRALKAKYRLPSKPKATPPQQEQQ
eukprot:TRINITY_DN57534_c0_g1_i1.p1 TRINITY_DN57534_c0_g1~~TRINITY_DN57534_c0_g1_i1.p1  ORF type:complete len:519 (-),score=223.74 TRINITY_DN57534_c0_g1_i1:76-1464(-)